MAKSYKQILLNAWRSASYNPQRDWKITVQPVPDDGFDTVEDYIEMAEQANDQVEQDIEDFCDECGFSYIRIDQKAFHAFERGRYQTMDGQQKRIGFREFLDDYAEKTGQNTDVDLLLVSSSVKGLGRATSKVCEKGTARDIIDYSRAMLVVLKNKPHVKKDAKSLKTLAHLIHCIENNERTKAYKNHYWLPHANTGFRAHKSLWLSTVPKGKERAGDQVLTEVKVEHESQMGIDCATRPFLDIGRSKHRIQGHYETVARDPSTENCVVRKAIQDKLRHSRNFGILSKLQVWLYNRINADAGLDEFLKPERTEEEHKHLYTPSWDQIDDELNHSRRSISQKGPFRRVVCALAQTGVLSKESVEKLPDGITQSLD